MMDRRSFFGCSLGIVVASLLPIDAPSSSELAGDATAPVFFDGAIFPSVIVVGELVPFVQNGVTIHRIKATVAEVFK